VYRSRVKELELTARQAAAIQALVDDPGLTLRHLADTMGADQATTSSLVERLLAADLVRRETDLQDRRRIMIYPTEKALELGEALAAARQAAEERVVTVLGEGDSAKLARILSHLIDGLAALSDDQRSNGAASR
jgi:DNA-binding MarR family transcriptional regulator